MLKRHHFLLPLWLCAAATLSFAQTTTPPSAEALARAYSSSAPEVVAASTKELEEQLAAHPEDGKLREQVAVLYLDRLGEPQKALPHLRKVVETTPSDPGWRQAFARGLRATGQMQAAIEQYRKATELAPEDAWAKYELANSLAGNKKYGEAVDAYRAALELDPKNIDARVALAKTLWADGKIPSSQTVAQSVLDVDPGNQDARNLVAASPASTSQAAPPPASAQKMPMTAAERAVALAYQTGKKADFVRAAEALQKALREDPDHLANRKLLAYLQMEKLHDLAAAAVQVEIIARMLPHDSTWLQMLAKAQAAAGDRTAAAETYRRAAERAPKDLWTRYHLGGVLRELGKRKEAEAAFREAYLLDSRNVYVRRELARSSSSPQEAEALARGLIAEDQRDGEAHVVLGDLGRAQRNFSQARREYEAVLAADPKNSEAAADLADLRKQQRPQTKLVFYDFDDTDDLRQDGIFTYTSALVTGRLTVFAQANERFFKRPAVETIERFEFGAGAEYRFGNFLVVTAGVSDLKSQQHSHQTGGNIAVYVMPFTRLDLWASYRLADPVNDSYFTAREAFVQNIVAGGFEFRPTPSTFARFTATSGDYSDGNTRQDILAGIGWRMPLPTSPVIRLEYEWLNYDEHSSNYSSPQNYGRFRPVLEITPQLTKWLQLELHGELSYVANEHEWGNGFTVGPRIKLGDRLDFGAAYMKYEVPGGQTTWSGEGFKVDLWWRF